MDGEAERDGPATAGRLLVVDDDEGMRRALAAALERDGFEVLAAANGHEALRLLSVELLDVVLLDLNLPGLGGLELLGMAPSLQTDAEFIVMTGQATVDSAVAAMQGGAYDYLTKPPRLDELRLVVARALRERAARRELARLRLSPGAEGARLVGNSPAMERLRLLLARVAPTRATVLITGETGTGKELVARTIHALSDRAARPFVAVNCSALPESLLESTLFGHMKGSFTGATETRRGLFEEAGDGTLFLDEAGTLPPATQVRLLRVLQERTVQRVGSAEPIRVSFRLMAATNVDLAGEVAAGRFREDLFYRLNVFPVQVPPLRERGEDVLLLAHHFRQRFAAEHGLPEAPELSPGLVERLLAYQWPGNVRELENFIQRSLIMHAGARVLPPESPDGSARSPSRALLGRAVDGAWDLARLEREFILAVLAAQGGQIARTAQVLGIDRRTLNRKLRQYRVTDSETDSDSSTPPQ